MRVLLDTGLSRAGPTGIDKSSTDWSERVGMSYHDILYYRVGASDAERFGCDVGSGGEWYQGSGTSDQEAGTRNSKSESGDGDEVRSFARKARSG